LLMHHQNPSVTSNGLRMNAGQSKVPIEREKFAMSNYRPKAKGAEAIREERRIAIVNGTEIAESVNANAIESASEHGKGIVRGNVSGFGKRSAEIERNGSKRTTNDASALKGTAVSGWNAKGGRNK